MNASWMGRQQGMVGGAKTVLARFPARKLVQPARPRKHPTFAQSTAVQVQELGNITTATGLARTGSTKINHLQPLEVRIETLMRQNQELESRNSALEMRNAFLESSNAELTAQNRNHVIRNHAMEKETTALAKHISAAANRIANLEKESGESGTIDKKSLWYSLTDSRMRLLSVEDELEAARYGCRRNVAAAREDTQRARAEADRQRAYADVLAVMVLHMMQACQPAEGC